MRAQPNSAWWSMAASSICRRGSRRAGRACAQRSRPRRWASWRWRPRAPAPTSSSRTSSSIRSSPIPKRSFASASTMRVTSAKSAGNFVRPRASIDFDFEGELAIVIGERCRHVPRASALAVVAGYTDFLDISVRDFQKHSVTAGKNFPATGPLGPWMVTADVIADPQRLELTTRLNGNTVQHDTTDHMIFDVAAIIEYLSTVTWLEPGDIIATGTPDGVGLGRKPPLWMKGGDKVEVEISGIGTLGVNVVDE